MALEYKNDVKKLAIGGLQLNLPPDLVPPTQYSQLDNAVSRIEGRLETRDGSQLLCLVVANIPIHSIYRLNQFITSVNGERLFGLSSQLWSAPLPAGNVPVQLVNYVVAGIDTGITPQAFDGKPLSIMSFQFDGDPQVWAIIANGQKMMKRKQSYYEQLGLPAPTYQPIAHDSGSPGNLNGDYFWYYTYVNKVTLSESNPSQQSFAAGGSTALEFRQPTNFNTPTTGSTGLAGTVAWLNPGSAFSQAPQTSNPGIFAQGIIPSPVNATANIRYSGFGAASVAYDQLELHVIVDSPQYSQVSGVLVQYSLDGGASWNVLIVAVGGGSFPQQEAIIAIPPGSDLTQLIVYAGAGGSFAGVGNNLRIFNMWTQGTPHAGAGGALSLTNHSAKVCVAPPIDPQETAIRLYRIGGTLPDAPRFVGQFNVADLLQGVCDAGILEIEDDVSDSDIAASNVLETDNDMPVTSVHAQNQALDSIWPFDERVLGVGDPARPQAVYFSKRGLADAWPTENFVNVCNAGDQMMAGFSYALRCFAFSREGLHQLLLNVIPGVTFYPAKTSCRRGLKGKKAFCTGAKGIYFVAKDGIFRTGGGLEEPIHTDIGPLFPTRDGEGQTVGQYEAVNMDDEDGLRLEYHNSEIWFDYTGKDTGRRRRLIFSENLNRWRSEVYVVNAQMCYSEEGTDSSLLVGLVDGSVRQGSSVLENIVNVSAQTGAYDQGVPLSLKEYANVVFDLDTAGIQITITPYINGNQTAAPPLVIPPGGGRVRVAIPLADVFALNMSFLIQWAATPVNLPIAYQMDILYRIEPSAMQHWQVPPYAMGANGWFHMRDAYMTLRSASDVTFKVTPDQGPSFTLTIPSTAGKKQKVYLRFPPNKAKLAEFAIDSTADFRIYQEECELRVKQWVNPLGYKNVPLFGAQEEE